MFVYFAACSSIHLKIDCNPGDYTWKYDLFPELPFKMQRVSERELFFYIKGHFVGFVQMNKWRYPADFRMRVGGNFPGDYFLTVGYALGWVSEYKARKLRQVANAVDFGLTGLAPKWWRSGYVEKNHTFETECISEDLFRRRIRWLYKLYAQKDMHDGVLILSVPEAERDRVKASAVEEHLDGFSEFAKTLDEAAKATCSIQ